MCVLQQFVLLENQTAAMEGSWNSTLATFTTVASTFNDIVINTRKYRDLADAVYIGFIDLNISNPMFNGTFYDDVNLDTLEAKQGIALQFVQESSDDWLSVANMFRARVAFYESTNNQYNKSKRLDAMFDTVVTSLTYGASEPEVRTVIGEPNAQRFRNVVSRGWGGRRGDNVRKYC